MKDAVKALRAGKVIAFPTDTVFGIGALLSKPAAIKKIYKLKERPRTKPLQILVADLAQAQDLGKFNKKALAAAKKWWPGPLTVVVHKTRRVSKLVTGGSHKVGLRIPAHRILLKLIKNAGPIVATSANLSGEKPALTVKAVKKIFPGFEYYLPGRVKSGQASKVIDFTKTPKTLRP